MTVVKLLWTSVFLLTVSSKYAQKEKIFFRKDYTYLSETSAFYKFHTIGKTWQEAKKVCEIEGATLMYPKDDAELKAVTTFWNNTQPHHWIWIGISDLVAKGVFYTVDGLSIADIHNSWKPGEPNDVNGEEDCVNMDRDGLLNDDLCLKRQPYMCKKSLISLEWNDDCNLPDTEYQYVEELGKCYRIHLTPKKWTDAAFICHSEQSYLAVINGERESEYIVNMTAAANTHPNKGDHLNLVWLGFHNRDLEGWKTITGTSLEDSGFQRWAPGQPDGGDNETCGAMSYERLYSDVECSKRCFFVCEHDTGLIDFNLRSGNPLIKSL